MVIFADCRPYTARRWSKWTY